MELKDEPVNPFLEAGIAESVEKHCIKMPEENRPAFIEEIKDTLDKH